MVQSLWLGTMHKARAID